MTQFWCGVLVGWFGTLAVLAFWLLMFNVAGRRRSRRVWQARRARLHGFPIKRQRSLT